MAVFHLWLEKYVKLINWIAGLKGTPQTSEWIEAYTTYPGKESYLFNLVHFKGLSSF